MNPSSRAAAAAGLVSPRITKSGRLVAGAAPVSARGDAEAEAEAERARGERERYLKRHIGDGGDDGARMREAARRRELERRGAEAARGRGGEDDVRARAVRQEAERRQRQREALAAKPRELAAACRSSAGPSNSVLTSLLRGVEALPGVARRADERASLGAAPEPWPNAGGRPQPESLTPLEAAPRSRLGGAPGAAPTPPTEPVKAAGPTRLFGGPELSASERSALFKGRSLHAKSEEEEAMAQAMAELERLSALEDMAEAAAERTEMQVSMVECQQCARRFRGRPETCVRDGHTLRRVRGTRHFRCCASCGHRAAGERPAGQSTQACPRCGKHLWRAAAVREIRAPDRGRFAREMGALKPTGGREIKSLRFS